MLVDGPAAAKRGPALLSYNALALGPAPRALEDAMLRRLIAFFDPAEPGFGRRLLRLARHALVLGLAAVGLLAWGLLRLPQGRYWWGVAQLEAGFPEAAIRTARGAIDDGVALDYGFYRLLAAGQRRAGQVEAQLATFDQAVDRFPDHWMAQGHRCWYGSLFGRAAAVMDSCDAATRLAPATRAEPWAWRAVARALAGSPDQAVADLEEALRRWDESGAWGSPYVEERRRWLRLLQEGRDPFDEETLERQRRSF